MIKEFEWFVHLKVKESMLAGTMNSGCKYVYTITEGGEINISLLLLKSW